MACSPLIARLSTLAPKAIGRITAPTPAAKTKVMAGGGWVVGYQLHQPGDLALRFGKERDPGERPVQGGGRADHEVVAPSEVRLLVGQHRPQLGVVEGREGGGSEHHQAVPATDAVGGGGGVVQHHRAGVLTG